MFGTALVEIPLENRDRISPLKKLCTAVSAESPDLFRIRGVPCIDRGPDKLRPPIPYEHWNGSGGTSSGAAIGDNVVKRTANFARPSSVSADTPNFFKIPGVAINSSSAITGVEALCSPPPEHQPFNLPETYMHGKDAKAVADPTTLPGRWHETDREVGQWGYATREFHHALMRMRHKGAAQRTQQKGTRSPQLNASSDTASVVGTPQPHPRDPAEVPTPQLPRLSRSISSAVRGRSTPQLDSEQIPNSVTLQGDGGNGGKARGEDLRVRGRRRRRASTVEVFMSRLEGERGPRNRRESIDAFRKMLGGCTTNNSSQFADENAGAATSTNADTGIAGAVNTKAAKGAALRKVLARRKEAQSVVSGIMGTEEGSYMLNRERDASKVFLGRRQEAKSPLVGVVRVSRHQGVG